MKRITTTTRSIIMWAAAALLGASAPAHAQCPDYLLQWGSQGNGNGQFNSVHSVATDQAGNVYVTDLGNNRVQKFDSTGAYITQWGSFGSGDGQFNQPIGVATDAAGNVYVSDRFNSRVQKFTSTGTFILKWGSAGAGNGQFTDPSGVATDAAGNVYVVDYTANRIQKFTGTGSYLLQWGSPGSGDGQFNNPHSVATDAAGDVYVTDANNNRVQKFNGNGTYLCKWGSFGSGNGQFSFSEGVATTASGEVYVADVANYRMQKFGTSPRSQELYGFGLLNTALGGADLSLDEGALVVSNIGSSGQDGVRIDLGESEGWSADFVDMPDLHIEGRVLTTSMRGHVNQVDDQIIGLARVEGTGDDAILQVDFSGIGSRTSLVRFYGDDGQLLAESTIGNNAPIVLLKNGPQQPPCLPPSFPIKLHELKWVGNPAQLTVVTEVVCAHVDFGPVIRGVKCILVESGDNSGQSGLVVAGTITGADLGSLTIDKESVGMFGQFHTGQGQAALNASDGMLAVSNIGSSGQDGVTVALDDTLNFRAHWQPMDLLDGGFLEFRATGTLDGVQHQPLGVAQVMRNGSLYEYTADYSELGSPTKLVLVFQGDVLVASVPNLDGIVATTSVPPHGCGKGGDPGDPPVPSCIWVFFDDDSLTQIDINNPGFGPVFGDKLLILAESGVTVDALQSFTIRAADLATDVFTIIEETAAVPTACPGDLNSDGQVDGADLGLVLGSWGGSGLADLNGDGTVNGADLGLVLGAWGPCQ